MNDAALQQAFKFAEVLEKESMRPELFAWQTVLLGASLIIRALANEVNSHEDTQP